MDSLDSILLQKQDMITQLRSQLVQFKNHLKEEDLLSKKFYEQRQQIFDVFDLNSDQNFGNDDLQLLDNLPDFKHD